MLGNVNQRTPYGSLSYNQTGSQAWTDPQSGQTYQLPRYTATQTLSPDQARLQGLTTGAEQNMARLAKDQSARLGSILGRPMNTNAAPVVRTPQMQTVGDGPQLQARLGDVGGVQRGFAGAGNVQGGFGNAGSVTRTYGTDFSKDRRRVEDALMSRMNPQLEQERDRLATQLSNQGIKLGSAAHDRAMGQYGQRANDAQMGAILAGGEEQSRLAGMEAQRAGFQNSAQAQQFGQLAGRAGFANDAQAQRFGQAANRGAFANDAQEQAFGQTAARAGFANDANQQMFGNRMAGVGFNNDARQRTFGNQGAQRDRFMQEAYTARNQPINEIAALLGGAGVQQPQFMSGGGVQMPTTDFAGLVNQGYSNQQANWQQRNNSRQSLMGGLFGLGASGIMASDRRLKTDVRRVGLWKGFPLYLFRYVWGGPRRLGVMAQDVLKVKPEAVVPIGRYLAVDYGRL